MSSIQKKYLSELHYWINQFEEGNHHPAFASDMDVVEQALTYVKEDLGIENPSFFDMGCATGNVLFTAKKILGDKTKCYGVDHNGTYIAAAKSIDYQFKLHAIDMFSKISKDILRKADVIFTYVPMGGKELFKLYKVISLEAKQGAVIMLNDPNLIESWHSPSVKVQPLKRFKGPCGCCDPTDIKIFKKL